MSVFVMCIVLTLLLDIHHINKARFNLNYPPNKEPIPIASKMQLSLLASQHQTFTLFIDTKFGYAVLEREFGEIPNYIEPEDEEDIDDQYEPAWMEGKEYVALPIESFFEMCKRQLRIMNWTPHLEKGSWGELEERPSTQSTIDPMMRVMIEAGWPGDGDGRGWNKKKAERDMQELWIA